MFLIKYFFDKKVLKMQSMFSVNFYKILCITYSTASSRKIFPTGCRFHLSVPIVQTYLSLFQCFLGQLIFLDSNLKRLTRCLQIHVKILHSIVYSIH